MAFEKFCKIRRRGIKSTTISIKGTYIYFTSSSIEKYSLTTYPYVNLWFDKENKKIGFEFLLRQGQDSFKFSYYRRQNFGKVCCTSFLKYHNITLFLDRLSLYKEKKLLTARI